MKGTMGSEEQNTGCRRVDREENFKKDGKNKMT
jgi:hypothetical protein